MFECFDFNGNNLEKTLKNWRLKSESNKEYGRKNLITYADTTCFALDSISLNEKYSFEEIKNKTFSIMIVLEGEGKITWKDGEKEKYITVKQGDEFFLPNSLSNVKITTNTNLEVLNCYPPKV